MSENGTPETEFTADAIARQIADNAPYGRIHVIINPAAGQNYPVLNTLNTVFQAADIDWQVSVTQKAGDARRMAQEAAKAGVDVVAVYGGDGTVMEAAGGLIGSDVPLAVLPGGTANALALALEIPRDPLEAATLITGIGSRRRAVDVGQIDEVHFLVAVGVGLPGALAQSSKREEKNRFGLLSYAFRSVQATREVQTAHYQITLDGREKESEGIACVIANAGNFGIPGLSLARDVKMDDGLLDIFVIRMDDVNAILSLAASMVRQQPANVPFEHWRARHVTVVADPPQPIQADGEVLEMKEVTVQLIPQAIRFIVPREADSQNPRGHRAQK